MTFQTTVKDTAGNPIGGLLVTGNDEITGQSFQRSTDGNGYADVAMLGCKVGDRVTLSILDPQLRYKGLVAGDALVITEADQSLSYTLSFKPAPSRDQVLKGQITMQGAIINTTQFGQMPWWPACWAWLTSADRAMAAKQLLALGDEVILIQVALDGRALYDEANQFYSVDKFPPMQQSLAQTVALVQEALNYFRAVWLFLDGDNGPYGYPVAVQQVQELAPLMGSLNKCICYVPGWDGVWYGYTPQQMASFSTIAKAAGAIYTGVEHSTGHTPLGNGEIDFNPGGGMATYDLLLGEFDDGRFDGSVWEVLARLQARPYNRPPDQPSDDDPNPPYYCINWFGVYRVFEYFIYGFVRGTTPSVVAASKAYFEKCGSTNVC
jgi:hypothetical protein